MVNQKTQLMISEMPGEVWEEIRHSFIAKQAIKDDFPKTLDKLDDNARYVKSGLQVNTKYYFILSSFSNQNRLKA